MNLGFIKKLTQKGKRTAQIILGTLCVLTIWVISQFNLNEVIVGTRSTLKIEVTRVEVFLMLILLLMNILIAYALFRQFSRSNRVVKMSTAVIIVTFLVICVWIARVFQLQSLTVESQALISGTANRYEVLLLLILIFGSILASLAQFKKFRATDDMIVMSAYSKKVKYGEEWISIEEFLKRELGVDVSHGITPEEKEQVLNEFKEAMKQGNDV